MGLGILGAADLANNIASATKGLATAFGLANPEPSFPQFPDKSITSDFQREHWYKNPSQGQYSFSVEPVGTASISEFPAFVENIKSLFTSFFNPGDKFGEFKLPITPQSISQTEDFAVSVRPTQGGTVVNHSGNKYKTLSISGTTGVQPFRGLLGAYKGTGLAIGKPDELQYRSGYEVFQHFRQWMRAYHEQKAGSGSEDLRMMFRNYKDWEFLYVEPIKFTMTRDANKPLLYNYSIQFKVLGSFTIDKPLFDQIVAKLNEISVALVNTYVLIKKNKSVTEAITGIITDLEDSLNNLKFALKAANKDDIKLAEFTKSDANKLSYKETLQVLGAIGNALVKSTTNSKTAETSGGIALTADPFTKGSSLLAKAKNPTTSDPISAKAELNALLDSEPALLTQVPIDKLPVNVKKDLSDKQVANALISRVEVKQTQTKVKSLGDKLADGVGLGDATYNQIFGRTSGSKSTSVGTITDDQFEMLYALSQASGLIDGVLSSDKLFDTNAKNFKKSDATNGASSIGRGIFSLPSPNGGVKEGFLPAGVSLEDLALSELGDSSRWTEIAELNGLKSPYIVQNADTLNLNYSVKGINYYDPTQVKDLHITDVFLIPGTPTPTGAWAGKGNYLAEYLGGPVSDPISWRFIFPDEGMTIQHISTLDYLQFNNGAWIDLDPSTFSLDGVLKPGDKIKIPTGKAKPLATKLQGPRDNPVTNSLTNAEKSLAVDLRLTEGMDLDLTPAGDLNLAAGTDNAAQAIVLKLLYEKGSLKKYPGIGTSLTPGKKMPDIATLRADITSSLLQDARIKNVTKINLIQENSAVTLSFEVIFNDVQEPVPITIPV